MDSNLIRILLLLGSVALIAAAVCPPLLRYRQKERRRKQLGADPGMGGTMAWRPDGGGRSAWSAVGRLLGVVAGAVLIAGSLMLFAPMIGDALTEVSEQGMDTDVLLVLPIGALALLPGALGYDLLRRIWRSRTGRRAHAAMAPPAMAPQVDPGRKVWSGAAGGSGQLAEAEPRTAGQGDLPWPEGWPSPRRGKGTNNNSAFGTVLFVFLLTLPLVLGLGSLLDATEGKHVFGALAFFGFGLMWPALMAWRILDVMAPAPRLLRPGSTAEPAMLVPPSRGKTLLLVPLGLVFVGFAGAAKILTFGIACLGVGVAVWLGVRRARGRLKGLVLTPSGMLLANRWRSGAAAGWDSVWSLWTHEYSPPRGGPVHLMISAGTGLGIRRAADPWAEWLAAGASRSVKVRPPGHSPLDISITIDTFMLRCDSVVLYHTLRFYMEHPEARAELGTQAAIDRIARRDLL